MLPSIICLLNKISSNGEMNKVDYSRTLNSIFVKRYYLAGLSSDSFITREDYDILGRPKNDSFLYLINYLPLAVLCDFFLKKSMKQSFMCSTIIKYFCFSVYILDFYTLKEKVTSVYKCNIDEPVIFKGTFGLLKYSLPLITLFISSCSIRYMCYCVRDSNIEIQNIECQYRRLE